MEEEEEELESRRTESKTRQSPETPPFFLTEQGQGLEKILSGPPRVAPSRDAHSPPPMLPEKPLYFLKNLKAQLQGKGRKQNRKTTTTMMMMFLNMHFNMTEQSLGFAIICLRIRPEAQGGPFPANSKRASCIFNGAHDQLFPK